MKTLIKLRKDLQNAGRWDIDFHLEPEGIKKFPESLLRRVDSAADVTRDKRDPTKDPEIVFNYIDISAVDVVTGTITSPQEIEGIEAPSRARKVVRAFDLVISTCRPTRGAIAVVPVSLHNQIASTGFSIIRAHDDVNPFYLHYALRLPSTLEQFRKWSTGSSYPAILDSDVKKTLIPIPPVAIQEEIAAQVMVALQERARIIRTANQVWENTLNKITESLTGKEDKGINNIQEDLTSFDTFSLYDIAKILAELPPLMTDKNATMVEEDADLLLQSAFDV
jgi:hypothetical protein